MKKDNEVKELHNTSVISLQSKKANIWSHPKVVAVNKDPVVFCLVSAIPLFDLVLIGLCLSCFSLVCVLMWFLAL